MLQKPTHLHIHCVAKNMSQILIVSENALHEANVSKQNRKKCVLFYSHHCHCIWIGQSQWTKMCLFTSHYAECSKWWWLTRPSIFAALCSFLLSIFAVDVCCIQICANIFFHSMPLFAVADNDGGEDEGKCGERLKKNKNMRGNARKTSHNPHSQHILFTLAKCFLLPRYPMIGIKTTLQP